MDPLKVLTGPSAYRATVPVSLTTCTKKEILESFENVYSLNESLFTILSSEKAFYMCPDRLRLPLIFYYGHTAVVFVNKLMLAGLMKERVHLQYETMFETGVDEMSWDDTENYRMGGTYKWPTLEKVVEYRAKVRQIVLQVIQDTPLELPITKESPWWAVLMGIDHERIHIETSSVLIRQLPIDMVRRPAEWTIAPKMKGDGIRKNPLICVEQQDVSVGKPDDFPTYGWDNEYPEIIKRVPSFEASAYLITNKQFLHFVNSGGYTSEKYWSKEGWSWCTYRKVKHPSFWVCQEGCVSTNGGILSGNSHCKPIDNNNEETNGNHPTMTNGFSNGRCTNGLINPDNEEKYRLRTTCEEISMAWDWPVVINYHEAKAYCNWLGQGYRILTEAEHHAIREAELSPSVGVSAEFMLAGDLDKKYNVNMHYGTSTPVNMYPPNDKGFYDTMGNAWEWTEDHFNGLEGFKTHAFYDDFSTPQFEGSHNVILGGSWASSGTAASRFGRYAFRRHFLQHAGFRIARSVNAEDDAPVNLCGKDHDITLQLNNVNDHMAPSRNTQFDDETIENLYKQLNSEFPQVAEDNSFYESLVSACMDTARNYGVQFNKALDLGCGCGRLTFELSKHFHSVIGSDFCGQFIDAAEHLRQHGRLSYNTPPIANGLGPNGETVTNGEAVSNGTQPISDAGDAVLQASVPVGYDQSKVDFKQFTWTPNELHSFDLIVHHFTDRVQNRKAWLLRLGEVIVPTGLVIILCTEDWTEKDILPSVQNRLTFVESKNIAFNEAGNKKTAAVTVWRPL